MKARYPRLLISAPASGSGKTYITCGLLTWFARKGVHVQGFKCGPDYIDPMFHRAVLGIPSRNLDSYFTEPETLRRLFLEAASQELSILEGAMGYFDGLGGIQLQGSASELAVMLDTPVVLVVDCKGMGRTLCAVLKGLLDYEKEHWQNKRLIQGVILNRMSAMLYPAIKKQIEQELQIQVLGYLPQQKAFHLESRHLGLKLPEEVADLRQKLEMLADELEKTVDVEALLKLAQGAPKLSVWEQERSDFRIGFSKAKSSQSCRIGVARDEAFCFYYEENLSLLEQNGARILPFSPLKDAKLPEVDGLLLGGGYPELFLEELHQNQSMRQDILRAAKAGMPILAECGGFMYLQEAIRDEQNRMWDMVGALPGVSYNTGGLGRFGYITLTMPNGMQIKAHEFHYFDSTEVGVYAHAKKPVGHKEWDCMVNSGGILAGFPHLYYPSCPTFATAFLEQCVQWRSIQDAAQRKETDCTKR